jgi:hypothetical protein
MQSHCNRRSSVCAPIDDGYSITGKISNVDPVSVRINGEVPRLAAYIYRARGGGVPVEDRYRVV